MRWRWPPVGPSSKPSKDTTRPNATRPVSPRAALILPYLRSVDSPVITSATATAILALLLTQLADTSLHTLDLLGAQNLLQALKGLVIQLPLAIVELGSRSTILPAPPPRPRRKKSRTVMVISFSSTALA